MSVVLHYAVPPGFNLASGIVGLTPRLWSPSAYYSLSLIGGPSGCRLVGVALLAEWMLLFLWIFWLLEGTKRIESNTD